MFKIEIPIPESGHPQDLRNAARVWGEGHDLCSRCNGTGNEFFAMYSTCTACGGSGIKQPKEQ